MTIYQAMNTFAEKHHVDPDQVGCIAHTHEDPSYRYENDVKDLKKYSLYYEEVLVGDLKYSIFYEEI
jgi:hypothetical protein